MLTVHLSADHLANWVILTDGNSGVTIDHHPPGTVQPGSSTRDAHLREAIS